MPESSDSGIRHVDGVMIIEPPNELLDRLEISNVGDAWLEAVAAERPKRVVINFDGVRYFGSEAIGLVLRIAKRVREYGGEVKLCSMGKMVREIFEVCHLVPTLFQAYDSTADAIASFED